MSEDPQPSDENAAGSRPTFVAAVLLGIAATLTALAAYQAALKDGDALHDFTISNSARASAADQREQAAATRADDQQLYVEYAVAVREGHARPAAYLLTLMRPDLRAAVGWARRTHAATPFVAARGNPYDVPGAASADSEGHRADTAYDDATTADEVGDRFELATVLLALTLFFGGIATLFRRRRATEVLLGLAVVALVAGVAVLAWAFTG